MRIGASNIDAKNEQDEQQKLHDLPMYKQQQSIRSILATMYESIFLFILTLIKTPVETLVQTLAKTLIETLVEALLLKH